MSWTEHKSDYLKIAHEVDPAVKMVTKSSWFWRALGHVVGVITFGGMTQEVFLKRFATTIGPVQAYPEEYQILSKRLIVHESRHTRQSRWFSLGIHPWVGLPLFAVTYLLFPFPIGLAYFRYRFEIDADVAAYKWTLAHGLATPDQIRARAEAFATTISSGKYAWSWPRKWALKGFAKAAEKVIAEHEQRSNTNAD